MQKKLVIVNPVNNSLGASNEGLLVSNKAANLLVEHINRSGILEAKNVIELCKAEYGTKDGYYTANEKNNAVRKSGTRERPVDYVISLRTSVHDSPLNRGVAVEYNLNESHAKKLYMSVTEEWFKNPLYIRDRAVFTQDELGGENHALIFNVVGNRQKDNIHIMFKRKLKYLAGEINEILRQNVISKVITPSEAQAAGAAVVAAVNKFREGATETRLSVLVTNAVKLETKEKLRALTMKAIQDLAWDFGLTSSLFIKSGYDYINSLTLRLGNLRNYTESIILQSEKGLLNHVAGAEKFLYSVLDTGRQ